jgi:hypothetical protein
MEWESPHPHQGISSPESKESMQFLSSSCITPSSYQSNPQSSQQQELELLQKICISNSAITFQ